MGACASNQIYERGDNSPITRPRGSQDRDYHQSTSMLQDINSGKHLKCISDNYNKRNKWGLTPLHLACEQGYWELVDILLQFGARVDLPTFENQGKSTALILAASGGNVKCVEQLLSSGANVNQRDMWGNSALFKASCYDFTESVEMLLEYGADPNGGNKWDALPLQYAALQGHHQVATSLIKAGADVRARGETSTPQAIEGSISRGHFKCVKTLLDASLPYYNVTEQQEFLQTLTFCCLKAMQNYCCMMKWDHVHILKLLLSRGASIDLGMVEHLKDGTKFYTRCECAFVETVISSLVISDHKHTTLRELFRKFSQLKNHSLHFLNMLINVGYDVDMTDIQHIQKDTMSTLSMLDIQGLSKKANNPRSLTDLSRLTIRRCLQSSIMTKTQLLPLPNPLQTCVREVWDR